MNVWKSVVVDDEELETELNALEKEGKQIKQIIPYRFEQMNIMNFQNYLAEEFLIVYTGEN